MTRFTGRCIARGAETGSLRTAHRTKADPLVSSSWDPHHKECSEFVTTDCSN